MEDTTQDPTTAEAPEQPEAQDAETGEVTVPDGEVTGEAREAQDTVRRHRYERDVQRRDQEIQRLTARVAELEGVGQELERLRQELSDERVSTTLAEHGCIDTRAARVWLDDDEFGGDVDKLKRAKPYLFGKAGRTGFRGAPVPDKSDEARIRKAMGLPPKE